jgi:hypothetical protein
MKRRRTSLARWSQYKADGRLRQTCQGCWIAGFRAPVRSCGVCAERVRRAKAYRL